MAERDESINQGDRSLFPILKSHSLHLRKRKHLEVFFNCGTKGWCLQGWGGETRWEGGSNNQLFYERGGVSKLCVLVKWSPHNFHHLFCIFHTRPSSIILGNKRAGSGPRAQKAARFFPWPNLGTRGFPYTDGSGNPKPKGSPDLSTLHPESGPRRRRLL